MKKALLAILLLPVIFCSVDPAGAASRVERDLAEMKRRLEAVEQATLGGGTGRDEQLATLTRQQADLQAELDALRVELQSLRGAFADLEHTRQELHELLNMMRSEMEVKFNALEERLAKLEERPAEPPAPEPPTVNPAAEYEAALKLIQKDGEFTHGRKGLQAFLEKYPDHELAVNAIYWIGEAYYGEKKYENAILQFQDVLKKHPQHNKAASALLKQALAFNALGDRDYYKARLKKVVEDYPDSPEAKKAKERLK